MRNGLLKLAAASGLAVLLVGCQTPDGRPNNTAGGALIGGASGAAFGAAVNRCDPAAGALVGGAIGLLTGALIGHSMDEASYRPIPPPTVYVAAPQTPPPSLADIKALARAGVKDDVIISQINNSRAVYQLDANAIVDLKNAGVSDQVITHMINTGAANAANVVNQSPPPPPQETIVVAPGPNYVWVGGEWIWGYGGWVWLSGRWVVPPYANAVWVGPRWYQGPGGWRRVPGYWR